MASMLSSLQGIGTSVLNKGQNLLDSLFPPEKRAEVAAQLQAFVTNNPKLSFFLLSNIALTGFPLLLFVAFTLTVFVFSLVAALLVGVLAALLFTAFMVGVALLVLLPTVFMTTFAASFVFMWGMGGYYILKWFNEGEVPAPSGAAIGDKLNSLTGGRLGWMMDPMRDNAAESKVGPLAGDKGGEKKSGASNGSTDKSGEKNEKKSGASNGSADKSGEKNEKNSGAADGATDKGSSAAKATGVDKSQGQATKKASGASGAAKGAAGGATGTT